MSGKHPFEPVVEQLLERSPLLGPRPPAVLAECFEIIGFEITGKRISGEKTTLVVKIGDAAFGMPGKRDGGEVGVELDPCTCRPESGRVLRGRAVGVMHPDARREMLAIAFGMTDVVAMGQ